MNNHTAHTVTFPNGQSVCSLGQGTNPSPAVAIRNLRNKVFLVSKVLPGNAGYQGTKLACERSLRRLQTESILSCSYA